jgi:damage-control phosphatase, subfamily I
MFMKPDCIPCILNMSLGYLRKLSLSETRMTDIYTEILNMPPLKGQMWNITGPEVIEPIMDRIMKATDNADPLSFEKEKQNELMMGLYPKLKHIVNVSENPLQTAAHIAILGNAIDIMLLNGTADVQKVISDQLAHPLPQDAFKAFEDKLAMSSYVLYFGDNAGEIVLDKLFIETLKGKYEPDIVYVVRGIPALNDATLKDAMSVGMDTLVTVMENGIDGPLPGTRLSRCSGEINDLYQKADLIISKGGGNFDTLEEEQKVLKKDMTYMLLSKCHPYHERFGVKIHRPILVNSFGPK